MDVGERKTEKTKRAFGLGVLAHAMYLDLTDRHPARETRRLHPRWILTCRFIVQYCTLAGVGRGPSFTISS
jgi:hypothetical protein